MSEDRRINVAITRARRHLCIIGDSGTISHHPFLESLVEYLSEHADVRSAHQYVEGVTLFLIDLLSNIIKVSKGIGILYNARQFLDKKILHTLLYFLIVILLY